MQGKRCMTGREKKGGEWCAWRGVEEMEVPMKGAGKGVKNTGKELRGARRRDKGVHGDGKKEEGMLERGRYAW